MDNLTGLRAAAAAGGKTTMIFRALAPLNDLPIMHGYRPDMTREEFAETWASGAPELIAEGERAFDLLAEGKGPWEIIDLLMEGRYDEGEPGP